MTKKKNTRITAAELMARLNADPEFVAREAQREEERRKREAEYELGVDLILSIAWADRASGVGAEACGKSGGWPK